MKVKSYSYGFSRYKKSKNFQQLRSLKRTYHTSQKVREPHNSFILNFINENCYFLYPERKMVSEIFRYHFRLFTYYTSYLIFENVQASNVGASLIFISCFLPPEHSSSWAIGLYNLL